jgi:hypothetical protein
VSIFPTGNEQLTTNEKDGILAMKLKTTCFLIVAILLLMDTRAFSLQYTFTPRASASETYTSNVNLTKNNEKDDFITVVSAGFTAAALGKTAGLEVSYDPAYSKYADFSENDTWRHLANLNGWSDLSKTTRFEVRDSFLRTENPIGNENNLAVSDNNVVQEGDSTIRQNRRVYYQNTANTRLSHQFGKDDSVYAGFTYGLLRNNSSQYEDNDYYKPSVGLNYWFGPKFGFESNAAYTSASFDHGNDFTGTPTDDFKNYAGSIRFIARTNTRLSVFTQYNQTYRDFEGNESNSNDYMLYAPSAGITYAVQKGLNLRLGGGYFYENIDNSDSKQGFFSNSQIDKIWDFERGSITLTGLTGLDQNNFGAQNIGLERYAAVQGSALYRFTRTVSWDINGNYRYSSAVGNADQGGNEDTGKDVQRIRAGSGFTLEALKWMAIRLSYDFNKVISDNAADEYDEHRAFVQFTLTPSQPYRYTE